MRTRALAAALAAAATPILADSGWSTFGRLEAGDPTYRPAIAEPDGTCSIADDALPYDLHEVVLAPVDLEAIDLEAATCSCSDFDTVVSLYAGGFDPTDPCRNLASLGDDECGDESVALALLAPGRVDVVVAGRGDLGLGRYAIMLRSSTNALRPHVFRSGFEGGDARPWSGAFQ